MMVVLAVAAVLSAIAIPAFSLLKSNASARTLNSTAQAVARAANLVAESAVGSDNAQTTDADIERAIFEAGIWNGLIGNDFDLNPADSFTWSKATNTLTFDRGSFCMATVIDIDANGDGVADQLYASDGIADVAVAAAPIDCDDAAGTGPAPQVMNVPDLAQGASVPLSWTVPEGLTSATLTDLRGEITFGSPTINGSTLTATATASAAARTGNRSIAVSASGASLTSLPLNVVKSFTDLDALGRYLLTGSDTATPRSGWMLNLGGNIVGTLDASGTPLPGFDYVVRTGDFTIEPGFSSTLWFTSTADTRAAVVVVDGDLTISPAAVFTPPVRKLFFYLHVTGTLTVDGSISMTARGANHSGTGDSAGLVEPVDLRVATGTFSGIVNPTVPASGGAGATSVAGSGGYISGKAGAAAPRGGTGGGGSGETYSTTTSGAGSAGTAFSGGTGGGGIRSGVKAGDGVRYGGAGGNAMTANGDGTAGGGTGNPGGNGWNWGSSNANFGATGTAGTLIVSTAAVTGTGSLTSVGLSGSSGGAASGGNGGGGSIHLLSGSGTPGLTLNAAGGPANSGGGLGGTGSVTCVLSPDAAPATVNSFCAPPAPAVDVFPDVASIRVNWTAPAAISDVPVTDYQVRIATDPAGPFTDATVSSATTTYTFAGLTPSAAYTIAVRANSAAGYGRSAVVTSATSASAAPTVSLLAGTGSGGLTNAVGAAAAFNRPLFSTVGSDETVYVADQSNNRIRAIAADGTVSTFAGAAWRFADGPALVAQFNTPWATATAADGTIYVADSANHRIRVISPAGTVSTLAGSGTAGSANGTGSAATFNTPTDLVIDGNGNLLVADYNNHRIRQVTPAGVVTTFSGSGTAGFLDGVAGTARFNTPTGLVLDADGSLLVADRGNHRIRRVATNGTVSTVAGSGTGGFLDGGAGTARFNAPNGVEVATDGTIYVADTGNHRIRAIASGSVSTVAGSGTAGSSDALNASAQFSSPSDVDLLADGGLLVTDQNNHRLRLIAGGSVSTVAGSSSGLINDVATLSRFNAPRRTEVLTDGTMYVADGTNHVLRRVSAGYAVTTFAGSTVMHVDGPKASAIFNAPAGLVIAPDGTMYVADASNHVIRAIAPNGTVSTLAGAPGLSGTADGTGSSARFSTPYGLDLDSSGNLLVADYNNHAIRRVTPAGEVSTIAGTIGVSGYVEGPALSSRLARPRDVIQRSDGSIAWTEGTNCVIRVLRDGTVSTLAGTNSCGYVNGTGADARLNDPIGIVEIPGGDLLFADYNNHRIRLVTAAGVVSLYTGASSGYVNGALGDARFSNPTDVFRAPSGVLYVADYGTHRIRRIG